MKNIIAAPKIVGEMRQADKFFIILELAAIFAPLYLGLLISDNLGIDHIPLGNGVVILGGAPGYLGLIASLVMLWVTSRMRGASWGSYGLKRPRNWLVTGLQSLGVALGILGVVVVMINPLLNAMPNLEPRDMSQFRFLTGNLPNLLINLLLMWVTAGFLEEFLWRGYLMERLNDFFVAQTRLTWVMVLIVSAVIFGLGHAYQGTAGILKTGTIGLVFGLSYLAVGRNLWPLVLAHALIDSLDFITHYLGG